MKAVLLIALAACAFATYQDIYDAAGYNFDIPMPDAPSKVWQGQLFISAADRTLGAAQLEFYAAAYFDPGLHERMINITAGNTQTTGLDPSAAFQDSFYSGHETLTIPLTNICTATSDCTVYITMQAKQIPLLHTLTTDLHVRVQTTAPAAYLYDVLPGSARQLRLVENVVTMTFDLSGSTAQWNYFQYQPTTAVYAPLVMNPNLLLGSVALAASTTITLPSLNGADFVQLKKSEAHNFSAGTWHIGFTGTPPVSSGSYGFTMCVGTQCGASASVAVSVAALVLSALSMLL